MGSEQSTPGGREGRDKQNTPAAVLQSPTTAALREGASSPRQDSVCSDSDVPYVSYTVNKPIGESPKKVALARAGRFTSPNTCQVLTVYSTTFIYFDSKYIHSRKMPSNVNLIQYVL